jgi:hypothetical protein
VSPAELDAIRARAAAATPGPWRLSDGGWGEYVQDANGHALWALGHTPRAEDAQFVAHARTDVPALLSELARVELEAAALRRALELLTVCACGADGGLDCSGCEAVPAPVRQALAGAAGRALVSELAAAREVAELARHHARGHVPYPLPGLCDALAAYDRAAVAYVIGALDLASPQGGEDR